MTSDFGFYGILTHPRDGYERLAAVMVDRAIPYIQLRMKNAPRAEVARTARALRRIVVGPSRLIINDDPEIARDEGADGVHLGQDDMPIAEARRIVGPDAIIGLSTHNPGQTRAACALEPDYIGVGPVHATPTKDIPDPVLGLDGMARMIQLATVPAVAIGGIDLDNAAAVLAAGARNLCAVRAINQADDPGAALDRMLEMIGRT
jgi:thiamine-phosphate pyrophosphorylase